MRCKKTKINHQCFLSDHWFTTHLESTIAVAEFCEKIQEEYPEFFDEAQTEPQFLITKISEPQIHSKCSLEDIEFLGRHKKFA
jgi:hypothetical protein